ncbi:MAG: sulfotransferase [Gammaproteobacteria bacterium]|jgi:hypothetical protein|nr:sulfotransferase [Gammaproteobacteria bacterium]
MLDKQTLVGEALVEARRTAFLDDGFEPVLDRLVTALNTEASLNEVGIGFHGSRLRDLLTNRLRMEAWVERYPEILAETIERPVVVVGLPRTGTTMLHRTIATDTSLLTPIWYEVRQPVPLADDFEREDERIGISEAEVAAMLEAAPELAAIHPMDARAPDEEIMLLEHSFMSTVPECYAHIPKFGDWLYEQDQSAGYDYLYRCLQFLQWQKRKKGQTGTRWLLKTPHHLHYPEYLFRRFPDAAVVQTHRHPVDVIPSYGSMMAALAQPFSDDLNAATLAQDWAAKWAKGLAKTMDYRAAHPEAAYLDLYFMDTVANPETEIRKIYDFAGLELTSEALAEMAHWRAFNERESRPEHHYQLADFGFDSDGIAEQFSPYIEAYF